MKLKLNSHLTWKLPLILICLLSCTELELAEQNKPDIGELNSIAKDRLLLLPEKVRDSTERAEKEVKANPNSFGTQQVATAAITSSNYALQATVSATSTYPGYSVLKIKDGSRNTTVGPSYSWANNYPDGTRLPQSVFLKWNTLRTINRLDIYTSSGYEIQNYTVQFRTTATAAWITLFSITGNRSVFRSHTFADISVLEIQIICQLGPPNQTIYARLNEVEVYGTAEPALPYITSSNGMLVFNSTDDVDQTVSYLEYKYKQYMHAFVSQYPGKTSDELADIEDATGFNDQQPYIDFENQFGIYSLRAMVEAAEDNWLNNTAGDETAGPDPDDSYMIETEVRSIVNSSGELIAGSTYYVFNSDGSHYEYPVDPGGGGGGGGGCTICPIQEQKISAAFIGSSCKSVSRKSVKRYSTDGNYRMKCIIDADYVWFGIGGSRTKAVTKSYKKKNGHWKKRSYTIGAEVYGDVFLAIDCATSTQIQSPYEEDKTKKITAKAFYSLEARVKNGSVMSDHYHEKIGTYTLTLTW